MNRQQVSDRTTDTIEIGKGVRYAKVAARSAEFHRDNESCAVETSCEFPSEGWVLFTARVTTKKGTFTGHSLDRWHGRPKQFEKQETIAVGRALAFAGYLADGGIASYEEMDDFAGEVTETLLNSVKLAFAQANANLLVGMNREEKQDLFSRWCLDAIGESVNYHDPAQWERPWVDQCLQALREPAETGPDSEVPFEA